MASTVIEARKTAGGAGPGGGPVVVASLTSLLSHRWLVVVRHGACVVLDRYRQPRPRHGDHPQVGPAAQGQGEPGHGLPGVHLAQASSVGMPGYGHPMRACTYGVALTITSGALPTRPLQS